MLASPADLAVEQSQGILAKSRREARAQGPGAARGRRIGMDVQQNTGFVIWLTGMKRAGKSTIAAHLTSRFAASGRRIELLDENGAAAVLLDGLGASDR